MYGLPCFSEKEYQARIDESWEEFKACSKGNMSLDDFAALCDKYHLHEDIEIIGEKMYRGTGPLDRLVLCCPFLYEGKLSLVFVNDEGFARSNEVFYNVHYFATKATDRTITCRPRITNGYHRDYEEWFSRDTDCPKTLTECLSYSYSPNVAKAIQETVKEGVIVIYSDYIRITEKFDKE